MNRSIRDLFPSISSSTFFQRLNSKDQIHFRAMLGRHMFPDIFASECSHYKYEISNLKDCGCVHSYVGSFDECETYIEIKLEMYCDCGQLKDYAEFVFQYR